MRLIIILAILSTGCGGEVEPEWLTEAHLCEAQDGFATIEFMYDSILVTCDLKEVGYCHGICKIKGECPIYEC